MSFYGDGIVGYGISDILLDDFILRFNLFNWNWGSVFKVEFKKIMEGILFDRFLRVFGVSVVCCLVFLLNGVLKLGDGNGVVDMYFGILMVVVFFVFGLFIISMVFCNLI